MALKLTYILGNFFLGFLEVKKQDMLFQQLIQSLLEDFYCDRYFHHDAQNQMYSKKSLRKTVRADGDRLQIYSSHASGSH